MQVDINRLREESARHHYEASIREMLISAVEEVQHLRQELEQLRAAAAGKNDKELND